MPIFLNIDYDALMLFSSCLFSIFAVFARHNDATLRFMTGVIVWQ